MDLIYHSHHCWRVGVIWRFALADFVNNDFIATVCDNSPPLKQLTDRHTPLN